LELLLEGGRGLFVGALAVMSDLRQKTDHRTERKPIIKPREKHQSSRYSITYRTSRSANDPMANPPLPIPRRKVIPRHSGLIVKHDRNTPKRSARISGRKSLIILANLDICLKQRLYKNTPPPLKKSTPLKKILRWHLFMCAMKRKVVPGSQLLTFSLRTAPRHWSFLLAVKATYIA